MRKTDDPKENYEKINLYPSSMQGLVIAHNISSISVKIKLVCKRNHIMGLFPIILYLLQFATEAFMVLITLILFFASAEYEFNSELEGTLEVIFSNFSAPHTPHRRANWIRLLQQVLNVLREGSSQHLWFTCQFLNTLMVGKQKS